jgi:hypothetical protein
VPQFRVTLDCQFAAPLVMDGQRVAGFQTQRIVEAPFDIAAGELARDLLVSEEKFIRLRRQLPVDPALAIDGIEPAPVPAPGGVLPGFVFYLAGEGE